MSEGPVKIAAYVCEECLEPLDEDQTSCPLPCPIHAGARRLLVLIRVPRRLVRAAMARDW